MVKRSRGADVRILAILFLAIVIVEKRNCENTPVNKHPSAQCRSSKDLSENCERPRSLIPPVSFLHLDAKNAERLHVHRVRSIKSMSYEGGNDINDKSPLKSVAGRTLLDLENPAYSIDSEVYEDNVENAHVRVKRDKANYKQFYEEPSYSDQKYIEDLADSFPPVADNENDVIKTNKRESNQIFNTDKERLRSTTKSPNSLTFALFKNEYSNESEANAPTQVNSTINNFDRSSNLTNGSAVVSAVNFLTTLVKFSTESGLKISLDEVYTDVPSLSVESAPVELIRKKRDNYDKEYMKVSDLNDLEYDDYYAERPKIRSEREMLSERGLNSENIEKSGDDYVVDYDRSEPGVIENSPGATLLRRKRHGRAKVYSELDPIGARSNPRYNFGQRRNTARIYPRSGFSNAEKLKDRFSAEKPLSPFSEADKTLGTREKENVYEGSDLNADEEQSRFEYRPLHNNRRQIRGKLPRYRRRIPMKTVRRAFRRAKKPSRKRKGKKHKRRKGGSSKRPRDALEDEHLGRRGSRIGSPRVVDEMPVESKIEKRESSDGRTEIEVAKRDVNVGLLKPGKIIRDRNSPADFARSNDATILENLDEKRDDASDAVAQEFKNADEGLRKGEESLNDIPQKEKEMTDEEVQRLRGKSDDVPNKEESMQSIREEISKVNEGAGSDGGQAPLKGEEKAALDLDVRIKRLIDAYREAPLSPRDSKDGETDSIMQSATSDKRDGYSKESEENSGVENSKARFKRHEIGARKHASRNNIDMKELKYYENLHEPEVTAVQEASQKENTAPEKFRDDRAVKSISEIRELAEKLVSKATELQSYVSEANEDPAKRSKKKVNVRGAEGCYSNATKIAAPTTTEKGSKIVERCVGGHPSSSKARIIDLGERQKERFAEEYSTRQLKSEKTASKSPEKYRVERAFERGAADRRKRKSRKWDRWTDWSSCSVTCGKGRQIRWRHCLRDCNTAETEMEEKACQLPACPPGKFLGIF